jgi:hypothetical protein
MSAELFRRLYLAGATGALLHCSPEEANELDLCLRAYRDAARLAAGHLKNAELDNLLAALDKRTGLQGRRAA